MALAVGDTVRVCKDVPAGWLFKKGDTGTIKSIGDVGDLCITVNFSDEPFGFVSADMVEKVYVTNTPRAGETAEKTAARTAPRGSDIYPQTPETARTFGTGATRDLDANKLDFEGFLSPLVLERYAEHMHKARRMPDGSMRESDNWQLGIPVPVYMKSAFRHFFSVWKLHRGLTVTEEVRGETVVKDLETELCALMFNVSGMLHEVLKAKQNG